MSSLSAFLSPIQAEEIEVVISERFQEKGVPVPWKIRPVTQEENAAIVKKYTKRNKKGDQEFDRLTYTQELTATGVVFPDLNSDELQKAYGVMGTIKLMGKMLLVGEYGKLAQEVQRISGLEDDINDEMEEAKN
ncbi:MAG: phage tail assembly chaperone [Lachnospiraceae bacterium]